jgi:bidirectional [NiFe] hydrogenase diaphorase subunit
MTVSITQSPPTSTETVQLNQSKVSSKQALVDPRFKALDMTMKRHQHSPDALIEVLHKAQSAFGFLEEDVLIHVARGLKLPLSRVYGVATFYHLFTLKPSGAHTCVVCLGTACHVKGSNQLVAALETELGVQMGETTADGKISLMAARCLGACGIAPAMVIDGAVSGKQTPDEVVNKVRVLKFQ